jgi:hypothetical protein
MVVLRPFATAIYRALPSNHSRSLNDSGHSLLGPQLCLLVGLVRVTQGSLLLVTLIGLLPLLLIGFLVSLTLGPLIKGSLLPPFSHSQ